MDNIEQVRYAPPGEYIKDHCFFRHEGLWHFFSIVGELGYSWLYPGNEERILHSTSEDLVHWQSHGYPIKASRRPGYLDEHMAVAPYVIRGSDRRFYMFYSGWVVPHRMPDFNLEGHREGITMAVSDDLYSWEIPESVAKDGITITEGESIQGRDPHLIRDEEDDRWLLYYTQEYLGKRPQGVGLAESKDLWTWRHLEPALVWRLPLPPFSPTESSYVLRHPKSGKWLLALNWHYAVSDNPLRFDDVRAIEFPCGLGFPPGELPGNGNGYYSVGVGFGREFLTHNGKNYLSAIMGKGGETKLEFTQFEWTDEFLEPCGNTSE